MELLYRFRTNKLFNYTIMRKTILYLGTCLVLGFACFACKTEHTKVKTTKESVRYSYDLSGQNWKLWLDKEAEWKNDKLHLPPVDVSQLPVNPPTIGWNKLKEVEGIKLTLPATVEEYHWGDNGNTFGVAGNYVGVSWFTTDLYIPSQLEGKRITLDFESVRLRAEVFVNEKLAGYDMVDGTPFQVDITDHVKVGQNNFLAVRITDPNGNFTWCDWPLFKWGDKYTIPSHGFGGITGKVFLTGTGHTYIEDVFVKNKPAITEIELVTTIKNRDAGNIEGTVVYNLLDLATNEVVYTDSSTISTRNSSLQVEKTIELADAKIWSPESPNLYKVIANWKGTDKSLDDYATTFGFRWFEIRDVEGDRQLYLNDKRIVLRTAISWGFWPVNGMFPSDELAKKQIETAKALGLNMLNFHRAIGHPQILDLADKMGFLYHEEPGGIKETEDEFVLEWEAQKLIRMIKRDRNHPSLIIYNTENESCHNPDQHRKDMMKRIRKYDNTRVMTYTSQNFGEELGGVCPPTPHPSKLYYEPYDDSAYYYGWWDKHHAGGPGVTLNEHYNNPKDYLRYTGNAPEIIFYGEEGAIGTPGRYELIYNDIQKQQRKGWDGDDYVALYNSFDKFLKEKGFTEAFPSVDSLTRKLGNVSFYYQGRTIENIRINNITDGYAVNGWEEEKIENHSGIVDCYRNPKGDVSIMAKYNQPALVSVKARDMVFETGMPGTVDFFIINEIDLKGKYNLEVTATGPEKEVFNKTYEVEVTGGHTYGQLLVEGVVITPENPGYTHVKAKLIKDGKTVLTGDEKLYTVQPSAKDIDRPIQLFDKSGKYRKLLESYQIELTRDFEYDSLNEKQPEASILLVGDALPQDNYQVREALLEWVSEGNTLIITHNGVKWAEYLENKEVLNYFGHEELKFVWYGGNYFVKEHPLFEGLPVNTAFNWEYQSLARYKTTDEKGMNRKGLRVKNGETVVGAYADHRQELYSAVVVIPLGEGEIILSTLDLLNTIDDKTKANAVSRQLLLNYLKYACK